MIITYALGEALGKIIGTILQGMTGAPDGVIQVFQMMEDGIQVMFSLEGELQWSQYSTLFTTAYTSFAQEFAADDDFVFDNFLMEILISDIMSKVLDMPLVEKDLNGLPVKNLLSSNLKRGCPIPNFNLISL